MLSAVFGSHMANDKSSHTYQGVKYERVPNLSVSYNYAVICMM
jgi:hypothetical protein